MELSPRSSLDMEGGLTPALRPAAGAAAASPAPASPVEAQVEALHRLDLHELRVRWRKLFRSTAPAHLPKSLLLRIVAYKLQAQTLGDLDRETLRVLDRIGRELRRGESKHAVPPVSEEGRLKPGSQLVREHGGTMHTVTVVDGGFTWSGGTYRSLSEVARAITGTQWNGPRFFGLRDRVKASPALRADAEARP